MMTQPQAAPVIRKTMLRDVDRALAELRRGAPVVLIDGDSGGAIVQAAETASDSGLAALQRLAGVEPLLLLTGRRAAALGLQPPANTAEGAVVALGLSGRSARRGVRSLWQHGRNGGKIQSTIGQRRGLRRSAPS